MQTWMMEDVPVSDDGFLFAISKPSLELSCCFQASSFSLMERSVAFALQILEGYTCIIVLVIIFSLKTTVHAKY